MIKEPYQMLVTGTIRKNKPHIPNEMKIASKEVLASKFCPTADVTLVTILINVSFIIVYNCELLKY